MDYQQILKDIYQKIQPYASIGKQADYIPALAKINPDQFGMCIHTIQNKTFMHGEAITGFSIQSISKVFSLAMCLSLEGDNLWKRVGKEPSGTAFNSLVQLEVEKGIPRNPFINAGAIVMTDILLNHLKYPEEEYLRFVHSINAIMQTCGFYDEAGEFSYLVGLPGKSGVGGGIAAVYPLRYSVAVWSPRLNQKGNSVMGIKALELLTTQTQESIF